MHQIEFSKIVVTRFAAMQGIEGYLILNRLDDSVFVRNFLLVDFNPFCESASSYLHRSRRIEIDAVLKFRGMFRLIQKSVFWNPWQALSHRMSELKLLDMLLVSTCRVSQCAGFKTMA